MANQFDCFSLPHLLRVSDASHLLVIALLIKPVKSSCVQPLVTLGAVPVKSRRTISSSVAVVTLQTAHIQ